jgi:ferritin
METQLLSQEIINLLEYRITQEEESARLYRQMSLWLENKGYAHLAQLYDKYAEEERTHAKWSCNFLTSYGVLPKLKSLNSPDAEYECCMDVLEATLQHELEIERQCNEFSFKALQLKHSGLYALGLKYCTEQTEEIAKAMDILDHAKLTSDMLVLDHYVERYL